MTPERIRSINETFYKIHKAIPLTRGMMAFIDECDYESVSKFKWHFAKILGHGVGYAVRAIRENGIKIATMPMHKMIMGYPDDMECDHIDGNGLNNRRSNLRVCTHAENLRNQAVSKRNSSGVTGVSLHPSGRYWTARIMVNQKGIHIGYFPTLEKAKEARLAAELKYFGDYRRKELVDSSQSQS